MKKFFAFFGIFGVMLMSYSCGLDSSSGSWKKVKGDDITLKGDLDKTTILWKGEAVNLYVYDNDNDDIMWQIGEAQYTGIKTFFSPVVYGEAPDGVNEKFSPMDLEKDVSYQITINLKDGSSLTAEFKFE